MKSALSDFILGKKGIYGILHIIILLMSLFLVISISIDTFKGIPFYTQSSYMKIQLWICIWFLFDFVLEFFLAKHKWRYIRTHFIFLLVAIPYQNIIAYYGWTFSPEVTYLLRFIPLLRGGIRIGHRSGLAHLQPGFQPVRLLSDDVAGNGLFRQPCLLCP